MPSASLVVDLADEPGLAERLRQALAPELPDKIPKARTAIERRAETLRVDIEADDLGTLRAAVNAYLQLLDAAYAVATVAAASRRKVP